MQRRDFLRRSIVTVGGAGWLATSSRSTAASPVGASRREVSAPRRGPLVLATYRPGLDVVRKGYEVLRGGGSTLDAVEEGVKLAEADPSNTSVGYGGWPNRDGVVQLDAAVQRGSDLECGSVAGLERIKHPVSVARRVLERTKHVMLVGDGARQFAVDQGFVEEDLLTPEAEAAWKKWRAGELEKLPEEADHDTMGAIAMDAKGRLSAACTTSGAAWKLPGRVGDSPLVGPGLYCDDAAGAAVGTGLGEEIIKVCGCHQIVENMRQGLDPNEAIRRLLDRLVARDPENRDRLLAFIAVRADGAVGLGCTRRGFSAGLARGGEVTLLETPSLAEARTPRW
jgi:isoaspartyl peptidase/L-asparaginase-like protein (Ntn-hydrolase superfamily)